ncbi:MAG: KH domain-containing protein, partial [Caldilineaceae bacterium]|nr:KH domain-containing protein [Caldilineaceae bacterium]
IEAADIEDDLLDGDVSDDGLLVLSQDLLQQMVSLMGYEADVLASWQEPEPGEQERCLMLDVQGNGLGTLIGRRGETLSNIQFLLRLMINQKTHAWYNIVVDVAGYKQRRAEQLTQLALRIADQVVESGRSASLEPMPSNERRIIHMALRDRADVYTQSSGEGDRRKVHIVPKD